VSWRSGLDLRGQRRANFSCSLAAVLPKSMRNDKPGTISYRADFRIGKFSISSLIPGDRLAEVLLNTAQYVDGMPRKCQRGVCDMGKWD
jgi:hypothetical protein